MVLQKITRTIQYFGLLRVPDSVINELKFWYLTLDVIRPPTQEYVNARYNLPYGFYGYVQSVYALRILQTYRIDYKNQVIAASTDTDFFLKESLSCTLEAIYESIINLRLSILPPSGLILRENPIEEWRNLLICPDEFKFKFLTENVVAEVNFYYELMDRCNVKPNPPPPPPPPPPPTPPTPPVPPNTPNSGVPAISPPYNGADDNGQTYDPDPGNEPPQGTPCAIVLIDANIRYRPSPGAPFINQAVIGFAVFGPVYDVGVDGGAFYVDAGIQNAQQCQENPDAVQRIPNTFIAGVFFDPEVVSWSATDQ